MGGEPLDAAELGWHGIEGDRRLALRRVDDRGGFPWLSASRLPELVLFRPQRRSAAGGLPTHVRTPEGEELDVFGPELSAAITRRLGAPVEMTHLNRGVFDDATVSVITAATVAEAGRLAAQPPDARRFRPNILIASSRGVAFEEDDWVGGVLSFGESGEPGEPGEAAPAAVAVTHRDERCSMLNLDPDSARSSPEMLKAIVRARDNKAGVYGAVLRCGRLAVGQAVFLEPPR